MTPKLVGLIAKGIPSLQFLGIYQCSLIGFFQARHVFEEMDKALKARQAQGQRHVTLDLSPMYHEGPNSCLRLGSYGVFWNDPGFWTAVPITTELCNTLWPKSQVIRVNIFQKGTAFRHFLDRLPLHRGLIEKLYAALMLRQRQMFDLYVCTSAKRKAQRTKIREVFLDNVTAALYGDGMEPAPVPPQTLWRAQLQKVHRKFAELQDNAYEREVDWWLNEVQCITCKEKLPGVSYFYSYSTKAKSCSVCVARKFYEQNEDDHLTDYYRDIGRRFDAVVEDLGLARLDEPYKVWEEARKEAAATNTEPQCPTPWITYAGTKADAVRAFDRATPFGAATAAQRPRGVHPRCHSAIHRYRVLHQAHGPVDRKYADVQYAHPGIPDWERAWQAKAAQDLFVPGYPLDGKRTRREHVAADRAKMVGEATRYREYSTAPNRGSAASNHDEIRLARLRELLPGVVKKLVEEQRKADEAKSQACLADWAVVEKLIEEAAPKEYSLAEIWGGVGAETK